MGATYAEISDSILKKKKIKNPFWLKEFDIFSALSFLCQGFKRLCLVT